MRMEAEGARQYLGLDAGYRPSDVAVLKAQWHKRKRTLSAYGPCFRQYYSSDRTGKANVNDIATLSSRKNRTRAVITQLIFR